MPVLVLLLALAWPVGAASKYTDDDDDDVLKPDTLEASESQYTAYWNTGDNRPYSDVVWKLHIYLSITPSQGVRRVPEWLLAGLTDKPGYYVYLSVNHLYNSMSVLPQVKQTIIVHGRLTAKGRYAIWQQSRRFDVNAVIMDPLKAVLCPDPSKK